MARVVHFEITADDVERARKFYGIFGWEITTSGMPGVDYLAGPHRRGRHGDKRRDHARAYNPQPVINWVGVGDLDDMIHQVKAAGGEIVGERQTVPGIGDTIYAKDTEGNTFGMIQPLPGSAMQP